MDSEYEHASPDRKPLTIQINHQYASVVSMLLRCMIGIDNEHGAIVFRDKDNNVFKTLQDSTTSGTIPEGSILIADSNGRASYGDGITIDVTGAIIQFPLPFTLAFGNQDNDGSMRIRVSTSGMYFGRRSGGNWSELPFEV